MVKLTLQMVKEIDYKKYPSNVTKEYYEIIRELMSVVLLLDGFKTQGEGAHKEIIDYLAQNYQELSKNEIEIVEDLRIARNRIAYDGFFVPIDYLERNKDQLVKIIQKLNQLIEKKRG